MKRQIKYKLNMKNLLMGLGTTTTIVVPIATLVSCGGHSSNGNLNSATIHQMNVDAQHLKDLPANISPYSSSELFQEAIKYGDKTMWVRGIAMHSVGATMSFLSNLAETFGWTQEDYSKKTGELIINDSDITNANLVDATDARHEHVEVMKSIVSKPTPIDEVNKREIHFEFGNDGSWGQHYDDNHITLTNNIVLKKYDSGKHTYATPTTDSSAAETALSLDATLATSQNWASDFAAFLTTNASNSWSQNVNIKEAKDFASLKAAILKLRHEVPIQYGSDSALGGIAGNAYISNYKKPGAMDIMVRDSEKKITRIITVENAFDKYPILSDEQLHNDIAPFLMAMVEKFTQIFKPGINTFGRVFDQLLDKVQFLIDKMSTIDTNGQKTFKIDDIEFFHKLKELNNGSTHWLALKTFFKGIDNSLVSVGNEIYNNFSDNTKEDSGKNDDDNNDHGRYTKYWYNNTFTGFQSQSLNGIKDIKTLSDLTHWAHNNNTHVNVSSTDAQGQATTTQMRTNFVAGMSIEDMDKFNHYEGERQAQLLKLISDNDKFLKADTSTDHLWNDFDTTNKTFVEIAEVIQRNYVINLNRKYLLTDVSVNKLWIAANLTLSSQELQQIVEKNKFLETNAKYLIADVSANHLWTQADLSKTLVDLKEIVAIRKLLESYDVKYHVGFDVTKDSSTTIKEILEWNKYKDVNSSLISAELILKGLTEADLEAHKDEIKSAVNVKLSADLSFLQGIIDTNKEKFSFVKAWGDYTDAALNNLITKQSKIKLSINYANPFESGSIKQTFMDELQKQGHLLFSAGSHPLDNDMKIKVLSFTATEIKVELTLDTKTADGTKHTSVQLVTFYRK